MYVGEFLPHMFLANRSHLLHTVHLCMCAAVESYTGYMYLSIQQQGCLEAKPTYTY